MLLVEKLLTIFSDYPEIISFFGGLFGGEATIITLSFLAINGLMPIWTILVFSTLGLIISDFVLFMIGRLDFVRNIKQLEKHYKTFKKIDSIIIKWSRNKIFLVIFYTKFIYGASIPALIYLGIKKSSISKFLFCNVLVNVLFVSLLISLGIFGGSSFKYIINVFRDIKLAVLMLIIFIIFIIMFNKWINKKLIQNQRKLK